MVFGSIGRAAGRGSQLIQRKILREEIAALTKKLSVRQTGQYKTGLKRARIVQKHLKAHLNVTTFQPPLSHIHNTIATAGILHFRAGTTYKTFLFIPSNNIFRCLVTVFCFKFAPFFLASRARQKTRASHQP